MNERTSKKCHRCCKHEVAIDGFMCPACVYQLRGQGLCIKCGLNMPKTNSDLCGECWTALHTAEFVEGYAARKVGKPCRSNPYELGLQKANDWEYGWITGDLEIDRERQDEYDTACAAEAQ